MKTEASMNRLVAGPDAGRLRITVTVTLSPAEELRLSHQNDVVRQNLKQPVRKRAVGPVARELIALMLGAIGLTHDSNT